MKDILGVFFIIVVSALTLMLAYCIGQGIVGNYGWFGVAVGILLSDLAALKIAYEFLKK